MDDGVCHWRLHWTGEQAGHGEMLGQRGSGGQRASSSLTNKVCAIITESSSSFFFFF